MSKTNIIFLLFITILTSRMQNILSTNFHKHCILLLFSGQTSHETLLMILLSQTFITNCKHDENIHHVSFIPQNVNM